MRTIPIVTKNLLFVNTIVFLVTWLLGGSGVDLNYHLGLHYVESPYFHVYQLATYMFLHGGFDHLFFNMFALWMFGGVVENSWGSRRFFIYYLVCGLGAGITQELSQGVALHFAGLIPSYTVGASGSVFGILLAFGLTWPEQRIFIFPLPIPIKAKWFIMGYAALEIILALSAVNDGVAHLAHIGGMLFGYILYRHWRNGGQFGMSMPNFLKKKDKNQAFDERNKDWEYNKRERQREEEIDKILDKVRRNGYESLSADEKRVLFEK